MDPYLITSKKVLTLVMVIDKAQEKILLGYKKRGFGAHLWNGFGGKVEPGETPKQGALRELEEEAGITVRPECLYKAGLLLFQFENDTVGLETHVYKAYEYEGQITECDEMRPQWFNFADIPYDQMWDDDRTWLPLILKGEDPFYGRMFIKRRPEEEQSQDATSIKTANSAPLSGAANTTPASVTLGSTTTSGVVSLTMTTASFTTAQPKNGPFVMVKHQLQTSLEHPPKEAALDGSIASFEN